MKGVIALALGALLLRTFGATVRATGRHLPLRVLAWVCCTAAAWMAAGAAGAWSPVWPALAIGAAGALADVRPKRYALWVAGDVSALILSAYLSTPPLAFGLVLAVIVAWSIVALASDSLLERTPPRVRISAIVLASVAGSALMITRPSRPWVLRAGIGLLRQMSLHAGLAPEDLPLRKRVVLETGAIAWLERPSGRGPFSGALFFHGANSAGSKQPAAIVVRRALLDAGFAVLAVDEAGFGESPVPTSPSDIAAWDPLPTALAAFDTLSATTGVEGILALGHSMGASSVFRLLASGAKLDGAILFGAALPDADEQDEYWYERFHSDRGLRQQLSPQLVKGIRESFGDNGRLALALPADHAPILFVRFGEEWPNIVVTRDLLYQAIPGRKRIWDLANSTHYFSAHRALDLMVGDTRVTRRLVARLRQLARERYLLDN